VENKMTIITNAEALRAIAAAIRKNHADQSFIIEEYLRSISVIRSDWDDSTYSALFEAVRIQYAKIKQLIEQTSDFPDYLDKLAELIEENKKIGRGGIQ